jgi:hypothetical protein
MLKVVIGFGLLTSVDMKSPIAPNSIFSNKVYNESIKNDRILKGPFFTNSRQIKPASEVARFNKKTLVKNTENLLKKISPLVSGRVNRYSAVFSYSSFRRIFDARTIEKMLPRTIM